jgi:hypothetical protein
MRAFIDLPACAHAHPHLERFLLLLSVCTYFSLGRPCSSPVNQFFTPVTTDLRRLRLVLGLGV